MTTVNDIIDNFISKILYEESYRILFKCYQEKDIINYLNVLNKTNMINAELITLNAKFNKNVIEKYNNLNLAIVAGSIAAYDLMGEYFISIDDKKMAEEYYRMAIKNGFWVSIISFVNNIPMYANELLNFFWETSKLQNEKTASAILRKLLIMERFCFLVDDNKYRNIIELARNDKEFLYFIYTHWCRLSPIYGDICTEIGLDFNKLSKIEIGEMIKKCDKCEEKRINFEEESNALRFLNNQFVDFWYKDIKKTNIARDTFRKIWSKLKTGQKFKYAQKFYRLCKCDDFFKRIGDENRYYLILKIIE